jgi:hypothetical protein
MKLEGGCYCKGVRYSVEGDPAMKAQCHCRECQYISGGSPNVTMGMPASGFSIEKGETKSFQRSDIENAVTREFCPDCGTHLLSRVPNLPLVLIKVGTLDDPAVFEGPDVAIFTCDIQPFHQLPEGVPAHERLPTG